MYRRTREPSAPRTWRTRKDPFADVWGLVQVQLDIDPSRTVKDLFLELQQRYPGKFADGQLRTLQRRAQQRRREQIYLAAAMQTEAMISVPGRYRGHRIREKVDLQIETIIRVVCRRAFISASLDNGRRRTF